MDNFREAIKDNDLEDLGSNGYLFTWSNRQFKPHIIEERFDRILCNSNWRSYFQEKATQNLILWCSDHNAILTEVIEKGKCIRYIKRTFQMVHYKDMWSLYEKYNEIIKKEWMESCCWNSGNPIELFKNKSKSSLAKLKLWSKNELEERR